MAVRVDAVEPPGPAKPPEAAPPRRPLLDTKQLDPHAVSAVRRLQRHGHAAYLVGGCVRDLLLGFHPKDFDVSTDARPEEVKALFRNSRVIGRRFRLVHLYYRGGKVIEVSTFRAQAEANNGGEDDLLIRRDNVFGTEEEDALRRDFTINGLFYDVAKGRIIDHVGGLQDVEQRLLRMIGDPDIRLREDPVRILRAVRFVAKAGLSVDPELETGILQHREDLRRTAPARLLEELLKLLRSGYAARTLQLMEQWGILEVLLPELSEYLGGVPPLPGPAGNDADVNRARLSAHVEALDAVVERMPVDDAVVLAALVAAPWADLQENAEASNVERSRAVAEYISRFGAQISLTKRLNEGLRQSFSLQRHLVRGAKSRRRRRVSPAALVRRPYFAEALHLFEVRQRARGLPVDDVASWQVKARRERVDVGPLLRRARQELTERTSTKESDPTATELD